ncbi:MAG TPA: class I SAM-dependent methyltransferase [Lachnospiraceae bacterium]
MSSETIIKENLNYWSKRASGYSHINREELENYDHKTSWSQVLDDHIKTAFPAKNKDDISVLEIGCGPGFLSILLTELGYRVTAVDLTPNMLAEAKKNAGRIADQICFIQMNAEELTFRDETFDVIVSRNLTWDLPNPTSAYKEWKRVLKNKGLLLNFDANWYRYLFDDNAKKAYEKDRQETALGGYKDKNIGENFDKMEEIARKIPLSSLLRPKWDIDTLTDLSFDVTADPSIWKKVWTKEEQINFSSTPMFLIRAVKKRK